MNICYIICIGILIQYRVMIDYNIVSAVNSGLIVRYNNPPSVA